MGLRMWLFTLAVAGPAVAAEAPFGEAWTIDAREHEVLEFKGYQALKMKGGVAWLTDSNFTDGIIEFDLYMTGDRGFYGGIWRMADRGNYEEFYMRPHQSGKPDANQYTPVYNGLPGWQLYHGPQFGTTASYRFNQWMHVKIAVSGDMAEFYLDSEDPFLTCRLKRERNSGKVGLSAGNFSYGYFANFKMTSSDPVLKGKPADPKPTPQNTVRQWSVSKAFSGAELVGKTYLTEPDLNKGSWQSLEVASSGLANLARVNRKTAEKDTVFASFVVNADAEMVKKLRFGYSDKVKVYLNGRLIYGGSNVYRSRDYRYLGTIGLFDELYLPLRKGDNQVTLAVTEGFGGWGVMATVEAP